MSIPLLVLQWPATLEEPQSEEISAIEEDDVGVKIGYDEINVGKDVRESFFFIKNEVGKERKKISSASSSKQKNSIIETWIQLGPGPKTDSARLLAELYQSSSANSRAGSTKTLLRLVLVTPLPKLHRTHSCFVSIGGIVGTLRFKNRGNSSFFEGHLD
ncbi:hypothetical protein F2Q69_00022768 [Brassica cretica]|uniref:Uncharacterized protein n=1 Tax=Brassica cretica TaxID=69181 RepID=A0A8S9QRL1_BRACR|nr:hypothetical protein F2Q69_00022768 [Brassica cretica]